MAARKSIFMRAVEASNVNTILRLFRQLTRSEKITVAEKIGKQTFKDRWKQMDESLPDEKVSDEDILKEVLAVRHGKKRKS